MAYRNGPHLITDGLIGMIDPGTTKCQSNVPMQNRSSFLSNWSLKRSTVTTVTGTIAPPDELPEDTPVYSLQINTGTHANGLHRASHGLGGFVSKDPDDKPSGTRWNVWVRGKSGNSSLTAQIDIGDDGSTNNDSTLVSDNETWQYLSTWNSTVNTAANFFDLTITPYTDNSNVLYICGDTIAQSNTEVTANMQEINTDPVYIEHLGTLGATPPNLVDRSTNWEIVEAKWLESSGTYSFDATGMYIQASSDLKANLNPTEMSVDVWVKYSSFTGYGAILTRWNSNAANGCYFLSNYTGTGEIDWYIRDSSTTRNARTDSAVLSLNTWHHIVVTYDDTTYKMKIFLDGSEITAKSDPTGVSGINQFDNETGIGYDIERSLHQFAGEIGAMKIYDRPLTAAEVEQSYNSSKYIYIPRYSLAAQAVIDRMSGLLLEEETAIAKFVDSQVDSGNWALIGDFAHYGLQTSTNALKGWKYTTHTANGSPTHTAGSGYSFSGSTSQYISSNTSTLGLGFDNYNAFYGGYLKSYDAIITSTVDFFGFGGSTRIGSVADTNRIHCSFYSQHTVTRYAKTGGATDDLLITSGRSGYDAANVELHENGVKQGNVSNTDLISAPTSSSFVIGARDATPEGNFIGEISSFVAGKEIGFDHSNFYDNLVILNADLAAI